MEARGIFWACMLPQPLYNDLAKCVQMFNLVVHSGSKILHVVLRPLFFPTKWWPEPRN